MYARNEEITRRYSLGESLKDFLIFLADSLVVFELAFSEGSHFANKLTGFSSSRFFRSARS